MTERNLFFCKPPSICTQFRWLFSRLGSCGTGLGERNLEWRACSLACMLSAWCSVVEHINYNSAYCQPTELQRNSGAQQASVKTFLAHLLSSVQHVETAMTWMMMMIMLWVYGIACSLQSSLLESIVLGVAYEFPHVERSSTIYNSYKKIKNKMLQCLTVTNKSWCFDAQGVDIF